MQPTLAVPACTLHNKRPLLSLQLVLTAHSCTPASLPYSTQFRAVSGLVGNTLHGWNQERWLNVGPSKKTALRVRFVFEFEHEKKNGGEALRCSHLYIYLLLKGLAFRKHAVKSQACLFVLRLD